MIALRPELNSRQLLEIISDEQGLHPLAEPIDFYKLVYQAAYGPSHMLADYEIIKTYIKAELSIMTDNYLPYCQDIGDKQGYIRISLSSLNNNLTEQDTLLLDARVNLLTKLIRKSMLPEGINPDHWTQFWTIAAPVLQQIIHVQAADLEQIEDVLISDRIPHHSEQYRISYQPHYRIVHHDYLQELQDFLGINDILEIK